MNIKLAKELVIIAKSLVADDSDLRDKIYNYLNNNYRCYSETKLVSVGFRIEKNYSGSYPYIVFLSTTIGDFFQGSGNAIIRDIKNCQQKIHQMQQELQKKFPGIGVKVIE